MSYDQLYKQAQDMLSSGDRGQALALLERASACAQDAGELRSAVTALEEAHEIAVEMDDLQRAIALLTQALAIAHASLEVLPLYGNLASLQMHVGKFMDARETLKQALALSEKHSLPIVEQGRLWNSLGFVEREIGNLDSARKYHQKALEIFERGKYPFDLAHTLTDLAVVDKDQQQLSKASASIRRAIV